MDKRAHSQMRRISLCGAIRIVTCHCSRYVQVRLVRFRCVRACWCVRMRCVCVCMHVDCANICVCMLAQHRVCTACLAVRSYRARLCASKHKQS